MWDFKLLMYNIIVLIVFYNKPKVHTFLNVSDIEVQQ